MSGVGDSGTPWERANFTGFSIQPRTVLVMASMSRAEITTEMKGGGGGLGNVV